MGRTARMRPEQALRSPISQGQAGKERHLCQQPRRAPSRPMACPFPSQPMSRGRVLGQPCGGDPVQALNPASRKMTRKPRFGRAPVQGARRSAAQRRVIGRQASSVRVSEGRAPYPIRGLYVRGRLDMILFREIRRLRHHHAGGACGTTNTLQPDRISPWH